MAELSGSGTGPAVQGAAEDEPGAEAGAQVEVDEVGFGAFPQGEAEGGGVGVLVDDDRQPGVLGEGVAQRVAVPAGEAGDPVQHPAPVVQRTGQGGAHPEDLPGHGRGCVCPHGPHREGGRGEDLGGRGPEVEREGAGRDRGAGEVGEDGGEFVAVQVESDGVSGVRDQPQDGAGLAAGGGEAARFGGEALRAESGGDLADGLRGESRAPGELQPADALLTGHAQQVEDERRVVVAQGRQIGPAAPAAPVHLLLLSTAPLSPSLALWQQRCLSGLHDCLRSSPRRARRLRPGGFRFPRTAGLRDRGPCPRHGRHVERGAAGAGPRGVPRRAPGGLAGRAVAAGGRAGPDRDRLAEQDTCPARAGCPGGRAAGGRGQAARRYGRRGP